MKYDYENCHPETLNIISGSQATSAQALKDVRDPRGLNRCPRLFINTIARFSISLSVHLLSIFLPLSSLSVLHIRFLAPIQRSVY